MNLDETGIFRERRFTVRNVIKRLLDVEMGSDVRSYRIVLADCSTVIEGTETKIYSVIKKLLRQDLNLEVAHFVLISGESGIRLTSTGIRDFRVGE